MHRTVPALARSARQAFASLAATPVFGVVPTSSNSAFRPLYFAALHTKRAKHIACGLVRWDMLLAGRMQASRNDNVGEFD